MNLTIKIKELKEEIKQLKSLIPKEPKQKQSYTTFEVARICNVQPSSIIKWSKKGNIKAYTTPGGHRRIEHKYLIEFMKKYKFPIPEGVNNNL